ncbi:hypothetical protein HMPREF1223_08061 [Pseudomonas aeruginosa str. Stone 130]|nr:hypothetical protein HMPREF1223_08061 [Pseudomonas aeruginosa str. Stone 130]
MTRANWTSATAWPDRPPPFHPWKLFFKAYPTKSLSLPLYPTIFSLYPSGLSHSLSRFLLEIVDALVAAVGAERVGLRLSPWGTINDMHDDEPEAMTLYLAEALLRRGIAYLHLAEWEWSGGPAYPQGFRERLRERFRAPLIVCGNYDAERAEAILQAGLADAVAIGRPFIANPDLVERIRLGAPLAEANQARFYGGDAAGYTDYPTLGQSATA